MRDGIADVVFSDLAVARWPAAARESGEYPLCTDNSHRLRSFGIQPKSLKVQLIQPGSLSRCRVRSDLSVGSRLTFQRSLLSIARSAIAARSPLRFHTGVSMVTARSDRKSTRLNSSH